MGLNTSIPLLILGGQENTLAITRHLGRKGIAVSSSGPPMTWARHSRYCAGFHAIPAQTDPSSYWRKLLLSPDCLALHGHMLLACSDDAVEFLANNRDALAQHYILEDRDPALALAMLDKQRTLELARSVGVPTPNFWRLSTLAELADLRRQVTFPAMVKPIHSHKFQPVFGCKLFIVERDFDELAAKARLALERGIEIMITEMIPGPDTLLNSYYTYRTNRDEHLFHFTKRIIRRYPVNRGGACYHITEWLPETAELGRRFFDGIAYRGMGNIEFKRDPRDGLLKVIEVNPRITAPHALMIASGAPMDLLIYCHLTGQTVPHFDSYEQHRRYWAPLIDVLAYRELAKRGEITLIDWLRSVMHRRMVFPIHDFADPKPGLAFLASAIGRFRARRATDVKALSGTQPAKIRPRPTRRLIRDTSTPVLLLGGRENALAIARNLGRMGVRVSASGGAGAWAMRSKYCTAAYEVPADVPSEQYWQRLLMEEAPHSLRGHLLLACNDDAVEFLANNRERLAQSYLLDHSIPSLQLAMLDKLRTLELAQSAGVPVPRFWRIDRPSDLEAARTTIQFPVMVKPLHSHRFERIMGCKLFIVEREFDEVARRVMQALEHDLAVMIVEMIPGPDSLLSSYYTYIAENGAHLLRFTKRVLRRHPVNAGPASLHMTEWLPETAELGARLLDNIGFRGIANVEFKRDVRDGQLKVIEVNPRFAAPHELLVRSGAPLDVIVYCHLTGQPVPAIDRYEQFRWLWNPPKDFLAFRQLQRRGELSLAGWVRSLMHRHVNTPIYSLRDPMPGLASLFALLRRGRRSAI